MKLKEETTLCNQREDVKYTQGFLKAFQRQVNSQSSGRFGIWLWVEFGSS